MVARNNLAMLLLEGGEVEAAWHYARSVYQDYPQHPAVIDTYVWTRFKRGERPEKLLPLITEAESLAPGDPGILLHLAQIQAALGNLEEARRQLERILAEHGQHPEAEEARSVLAGLNG